MMQKKGESEKTVVRINSELEREDYKEHLILAKIAATLLSEMRIPEALEIVKSFYEYSLIIQWRKGVETDVLSLNYRDLPLVIIEGNNIAKYKKALFPTAFQKQCR